MTKFPVLAKTAVGVASAAAALVAVAAAPSTASAQSYYGASDPCASRGVTGALVTLTASWLCAFYVDKVAKFGATYGSIAAVVVLLIWISWNVNAVFYGGALATEIDLVLDEHAEEPAAAV